MYRKGQAQMNKGTVQRVIEIFHEAFSDLKVNVPMKDLEDMAVLVHRAMTLQTRHFHTLEHVFSFTSAADPIQSLAALFHDIVYYQVDEGFIPEIQVIISPFIHQIGEDIALSSHLLDEDRILQLTLEVFNFIPGKTLSPNNGLNEFLSALVMAKKLQGVVSDQDLLKMIVCIEATIPFQGKNEKGETHFDILEQRLKNINEKYYCCLDQSEIIEALRLAVTFSNKDVESFSEKYAGQFLDNTWKLLPETNVALRSAEIYSIREYRQALHKMEIFFSSSIRIMSSINITGYLPIENITKWFDKPTTTCSRRVNICVSNFCQRQCWKPCLKLQAETRRFPYFPRISTTKADISSDMMIFYYKLLNSAPVDTRSILYKLFFEGRPAETSFDIKTSPLSLFLYSKLDRSEINRLHELARRMFMNELNPDQFLREINHPIIAAVANACALMVLTRREKLHEFARSL